MLMHTSDNSSREHIRRLYREHKSAAEVSIKTGIPVSTIRRWCTDIRAEVKKQEAADQITLNAQVAAMRNDARTKGYSDFDHYAAELGKSVNWVTNAMLGNTFKHINKIAPPYAMIVRKTEERAKARIMYQEGKSYSTIAAELGVSKSSLSLWLRDLAPTPRPSPVRKVDETLPDQARALYREGKLILEICDILKVHSRRVSMWCQDIKKEVMATRVLPKLKPSTRQQRLTNGKQVLTDDDVVAIRRSVKADAKKGWRIYADKYHCSITCVSMAARGVTFRHVNHIESPVNAAVMAKNCPKANKTSRLRPDETLVAEALTMRRSDPNEWTYSKLAQWMGEKTGRKYQPGHIAILLGNRDPSIKLLKPEKPANLPRAKSGPKPMTPEQIKAKAQRALERREELRKMIAAEDAREAWFAAGQPADWIWPE